MCGKSVVVLKIGEQLSGFLTWEHFWIGCVQKLRSSLAKLFICSRQWTPCIMDAQAIKLTIFSLHRMWTNLRWEFCFRTKKPSPWCLGCLYFDLNGFTFHSFQINHAWETITTTPSSNVWDLHQWEGGELKNAIESSISWACGLMWLMFSKRKIETRYSAQNILARSKSWWKQKQDAANCDDTCNGTFTKTTSLASKIMPTWFSKVFTIERGIATEETNNWPMTPDISNTPRANVTRKVMEKANVCCVHLRFLLTHYDWQATCHRLASLVIKNILQCAFIHTTQLTN